MEVTTKLTKDDIERLKEANAVLDKISCTGVVCGMCPLFVKGTCLTISISNIIYRAEGGNIYGS